jgi:hypothetical protein
MSRAVSEQATSPMHGRSPSEVRGGAHLAVLPHGLATHRPEDGRCMCRRPA